MNKHLVALLCLFFPLSSHAQEESRTWTNTQGKTIEGTIVSKTASSVTLKLPNGKTASVPLAQLSADDNRFVSAWKPSEKPSPTPDPDRKEIKEQKGSNFNAPWPKIVKVSPEQDVTVIKEDMGEYIYETKHFRFESDGKLSLKLMRTLSCIFEATLEANCALPLNSLCLGVKRDPQNKYLAKLYETTDAYLRETKVPALAAGVFINGVVHVPFASLGLKKMGKTYTIDSKGDPKTLIHEITHQMTLPARIQNENEWYPIWFSEGIAEYVANTPFKSPMFNFGQTKNFLVEYVTEYGKKNMGGRNIGKEFTMPSLEVFMNMPHKKFMSGNLQANYGFSSLLVYYFFHIEEKKDAARIKKYLEAFQTGKGLKEANKILLDGRSWPELEKDVADGMKRTLKLKVTFSS